MSAPTPPSPSMTTRITAAANFPVRPVPPDAPHQRCRYCRPWLMVAARGRLGRGRTRGGRGGGPRCCTHSSGSDPTWCGRWGEEEQRDVGGITWQTTSGWGRRRRRRGTASATTMTTTTRTTMATGEEDVEGQVDMRGGGREEGEEVCLAVLIIVISIIDSVTILSISVPLLV